jgi:hypothetical protein
MKQHIMALILTSICGAALAAPFPIEDATLASDLAGAGFAITNIGHLVATGTVTATAIVGDGSGLTDIPSSAITEADPAWHGGTNAIWAEISTKLGTSTWATADSTTNYLARTGGTVYGPLTFGVTNIWEEIFIPAGQMMLPPYSDIPGSLRYDNVLLDYLYFDADPSLQSMFVLMKPRNAADNLVHINLHTISGEPNGGVFTNTWFVAYNGAADGAAFAEFGVDGVLTSTVVQSSVNYTYKDVFMGIASNAGTIQNYAIYNDFGTGRLVGVSVKYQITSPGGYTEQGE